MNKGQRAWVTEDLGNGTRTFQTVDGIESPLMEENRDLWDQIEHELDRIKRELLILKIVAVMGWLAFLAVVIVGG